MKRARRLSALIAVAVLAACGRAAPDVEARPPLWRISDGDTTVWVLGGMHMLPAGMRWRTPAVERAIGAARELVLESSPDDRADFAAIAGGTALPPLARRVPTALLSRLEAAVARGGAPAATLDRQKSWAAAVVVATGDASASGASTRYGVDRALWDAFARRKRAVFYRSETQLRMLDALPPALQDRMLADALDPAQGYAATLRSWAKGDMVGLARGQGDPALAERLVVQPNRAWAGWIARRLQRPGAVLVAVGAGHLAGPDALPAMLARRGLKVERVE